MIRTDFSNCLTASESLRVPFHDVDPAEVVWHGRYFKYFEAARSSLMDSLEYNYAAMMESGYVWPVVDTSVRFVRPLVLGQRFVVTACLREWELRLVIDYKVVGDDGVLCTKARTVQVPIDVTTKELRIGSPPILLEKVRAHLDSSSSPLPRS
jgi:acyl-CoA thioester hydrolase